MLKTLRFTDGLRGEDMGKPLKLVHFCRVVGISRGSAYKYIAERKLNAKRMEYEDGTVEFLITQEEAKRFGDLLKRKVKRGQSLL